MQHDLAPKIDCEINELLNPCVRTETALGLKTSQFD